MVSELTGSLDFKAAQRIKCFGHSVPLYPCEVADLDADIMLLAKARKKAAKLYARCALEFTHPKKGPKARYNYLSSLACLQFNMFEANVRRPYRHRLSPHEIINASENYVILMNANEPVNVFAEPKSSGVGYRTVCDFGPVARGAQRMSAKVIRMAYTPAPFQFTSLGVDKAIKEALRLITEEGYCYYGELDINSHYPSFTEQGLVDTLPLPKSAIRQIIMAASAKWTTQHSHSFTYNNLIHPTPLRLPQGSAASPVVAEWSISHLKMISVKDVALINYADNFFLLSKNKTALKFALEALRSAIAELPGGVFTAHPDKDDPGIIRTLTEGFGMLGCEIVLTEEGLNVAPSKASVDEMEGRFWLESHVVEALLISALKDKDTDLRFEGVQAFLKLENFLVSWLAAHSFCSDIHLMTEDLEIQIAYLADAYNVTQSELKSAADASTSAHYYAASKSSVF